MKIFKDLVKETNLPKLAQFSISFINLTAVNRISKFMENHNVRHGGVRSVDLCCSPIRDDVADEEEPALTLVSCFSGVNKFKLTFKTSFLSDYAHKFVALTEMMASLGGWDLTCGEIDVEMVPHFFASEYKGPRDLDFGSALVIAVLAGMANWRGYHFTQLIIVIINIEEYKFIGLAKTSLKFIGHQINTTNNNNK